MNDSKLNNLLDSRLQLDAGATVREAWQLMMREPGLFIAYCLVAGAISVTAAFIPFVGTFAGIILSGPLAVGYLHTSRKLDNGQPIQFGDFFEGFNKISPLIVASLIQGIFLTIGFILLIIPGIYLAVAYAFAYCIVWFEEAEGWNALEASRKIITKIWWQMLVLFILIFLINLAGALALGIGLLFTIPLSGIVIYVAYKNVVGFDNEMQIEDHLH